MSRSVIQLHSASMPCRLLTLGLVLAMATGIDGLAMANAAGVIQSDRELVDQLCGAWGLSDASNGQGLVFGADGSLTHAINGVVRKGAYHVTGSGELIHLDVVLDGLGPRYGSIQFKATGGFEMTDLTARVPEDRPTSFEAGASFSPATLYTDYHAFRQIDMGHQSGGRNWIPAPPENPRLALHLGGRRGIEALLPRVLVDVRSGPGPVDTRAEQPWAVLRAADKRTRRRGIERSLYAFDDTRMVLAVVGDKHDIAVVDLTTRRLRARFYARVGVLQMKLSGDAGRLLLREKTDLTLCDVAGARVIASLYEPELGPVDLSRDGKQLCGAFKDGIVVVWNADTLEPKHSLEAHDGEVLHALFTPDGSSLITAGADQQIKLWDLGSGSTVDTISADGKIDMLGLGDGGKVLVANVSQGFHHTARAWKLPTSRGKAKQLWTVPRNKTAQVLPDGDTVAVSNDQHIHFIAMRSGKTVQTIELSDIRGDLPLSIFAYSPDNKTMLAGSLSGTTILVDRKTSTVVLALDGQGMTGDEAPRKSTGALAFAADNDTILIASIDAQTDLWSIEGLRSNVSLVAPTRSIDIQAFHITFGDLPVDSLDLSRDGKTIAVAHDSGQLPAVLVTIGSGRSEPITPVGSPSGHTRTTAVAFVPGSDRLVVASTAGPFLCNPRKLKDPGRFLKPSEWMTGVVASPNGKLLAAHDSRICRLYEIESGRLLHETAVADLDGIRRKYSAVAFSPDSTRLAIAARTSHSDSGRIQVIDTQTGEQLVALPANRFISSIAFSPDGKSLAAGGSEDRAIWTFDLDRQRKTKSLKGGHLTIVGQLLFVSENTLASAGADGRVVLWNWKKRRPRATLGGHDSPIRSMTLSADGNTLLAGGTRPVVKMWDVSEYK